MTTEFSDFRNSCTKNAPSFVYYYRGNIAIESKSKFHALFAFYLQLAMD
jgi:hypothetical protein